VSDLSLPDASTPRRRQEIISIIALVVIAILIAFFIKAFVIQPYEVDGVSMYPTLHNGDRLLVDKLPGTLTHLGGHKYIPKRGDIIIFNEDNLPGYVGTRQLVKRVIGLPGNKVVVENNTVRVYDQAHPNGFNPDKIGTYTINVPSAPNTTITLGKNELFVMGDNRPNSEDSRYFGPINLSQVIGKLWLRIYPLGQAHHF